MQGNVRALYTLSDKMQGALTQKINKKERMHDGNFTSFSTVFRPYQDDWRMILRDHESWNPDVG